MEAIALKRVLLYCLKCFLTSQYKEEEGSFTDFSQNRKADLPRALHTSENSAPSEYRIPLQKRCDAAEVLYVSALPQLFEKGLWPRINPSNRDLSAQEITRRFTKQLQVFQLKPLTNDSICTEETRSVFSNLWQSFKIESDRPGWISFRLSHQGIYTWINQVQDIGQMADLDHTLVIKKPLSKPAENSSALQLVNQRQQGCAKAHIDELISDELVWQAQYTHARCCSLIRSWRAINPHSDVICGVLQRENRLARQKKDLSALQSILDSQPPTSTHQLIQLLIETADDMFWLPKRYPYKQSPHHQPDSNQSHSNQAPPEQVLSRQSSLLLKRAEQLTLAFDQFHRAQALIPNASRQFPYATLLKSTGNLMGLLLRCHLQVPAPSRL